MARGWESKSVEDQQAQFTESQSSLRHKITEEQSARLRQIEGLILSRKRILRQLEAATDPGQHRMLESALSHLESEIARLG